MSDVLKSDIGPISKRFVLLVLADAANEEGVCWPSMGTIAARVGCSLSTARAAVGELESDGLLRRTMRPKERNRNQSNWYELNVTAIGGPTGNRWEVPPDSGGSPTEDRRENHHLNQLEPKDLLTKVSETSDLDQGRQDETGLFDTPATPSVQASLPEGFDQFWATYPRKKAKKAALGKYRAALKSKHSAESIMDGLRRSLAEWTKAGTTDEFIPYPATWLNQERFADGAEEQVAVRQAAREVESEHALVMSDPVGWLRGEWLASRVDRIQRYFRALYLPPELDIIEHGRLNRDQYEEQVVRPYNRVWIEKHRADILASIAVRAAEGTR